MCVYSAVMDSWSDRIPTIEKWVPLPYKPYSPSKTIDEINWKEIVEAFKEEAKKAKDQDIAEGNPDCADPEKAKLEERVRELETLLNSKPEFVIVKRQNLQPGKYRVVDNKLCRVLD